MIMEKEDNEILIVVNAIENYVNYNLYKHSMKSNIKAIKR